MVRSSRSLFNESFPFRVALGFAASSLALAILGLLAVGQYDYVVAFEEAMREAAQQMAAPWVTDSLRIVTRLGSTLVLTIVGSAAMIAFIILKWWRAAGLFLLAMAGQIILHHGFKAIFARERPEPLLGYVVGDSYSYPSGHALASLSVYGILAWLFTNRIRMALVNVSIWAFVSILVLLIGFSRIYFGVHNATDVIAGYLGALIWTASVASGDDPPQSRRGHYQNIQP